MAFSSFNSVTSFMSFVRTITLTFPNVDISMISYYPLNTATNGSTANYANGTLAPVYNGTITLGQISTNITNVCMGNGALDISSNSTTGGVATKYIQISSPFIPSANSGMTISIWFNPSNLPAAGNLSALFDLGATANSKGIFVDLSGNNSTIISGYYA